MTRIQHPAWVTGRGRPSRVSIGDTDYDLDDEGYFEVADETDATELMDSLAATYGVEYDDEGEVVAGATPDPTPTESEQDGGDTDEGDDTASDADDGEALAEAGADAQELQDLGIDELRERARDHDDVDADAIHMGKKDEIVAALMQAETDAFSNPSSDTDQ